MKQKLSIITLSLMLITATLTGCTVKQNPQSSPAQTFQPTSAPSQQGALPDVDYSIPNRSVMGSDYMVTDGKKLFFLESDGIVSYNHDTTGKKQIIKNPRESGLNYHELSYSNGWLYYVATDGIYIILAMMSF